jgi:hypothetical protein
LNRAGPLGYQCGIHPVGHRGHAGNSGEPSDLG